MAKKATKEQVIFVRGMEAGDSDPETEVDQDELRALTEMDGGSDVKWTVMRTSDTGDKKAGFCGELTTGDLSMAKIAEEWGRGKYRVRGTRSNGTFVKQYTIVVAEDPKRAPQVLMPAAPQSSLQDMIALMDARAAESSERTLKWIGVLGPLLAPIITSLLGGSKGATLTELTAALANIKQLEGGSKVDQMSEFTKLLELVDRVKGDGEKVGSTWADIARDGIQQIGPILGGLAASRGIVIPPKSGAGTDSAPISNPQGAEAPMLQLLAWLKRQLEALTYQASMNKDPSLYAEVMLDNIPPGTDPRLLLDYLSKPDWWQLIVGFYPAVQPYPQWFAECREELVKGLNAMLAPPQLDPPAAASPVPVVGGAKPKAPKAAK